MTGPLHQRIRADIEARIRSGEWPPGHRVPFETELMADYGCARMTVSKAMAALVDAGLIVRRKRAGTFVARPRVHAPVLNIPDIQSEIVARGETYAFRLLSRTLRQPDRDSPEEVALAAGGKLLALDGVHDADGRPFALERRLVSLKAVPEIAEADFAQTPPGAWLLEHVAWTEAESRISAVNADPDDARLLALDEGAACLVVDRRTWREGQHVTRVRQIFPGEAYDLVARFGPGA
ncbi:histidine utilization repressor [Caulobacter vibrioides]|uniref:Histidine utilization repressor n=2 Tax=Caulobacter vibrioides TaxID=155892 RepID=Q9A9L8_CAUVC|nr:histidine utilization repressor [Caulobacter vibrioides]YP_002516386.1 histidine utilization repressor [Caulobacter vibrioides NA1000]AAK22946.1 histidine utilization repressor [Caulobacter vibrioides CB15]ACL94478.1 histidine utilization repressor [Caulobacter vibrioides NA1000]ATC27796.1 histidine utilization repressor [Caulobacter vibrioides]QXZ53038.1 histidine utilization repressor [Caulobacter vibrioides]